MSRMVGSQEGVMADIVRVGFIGAGGIARAHAKALADVPDVELIAVTDASPEAADKFAETAGLHVYASARDLVRDAGVDAVFILVPPFARGESEFAAIEAGVPFFIEKPLGLDMKLLHEISTEIRIQDHLHSVGYMNRYRAGVNEARRLLQSDHGIMAFGGWFGGTPGPHPWFTDASKSGGQFHEQVTHTVDLARYLLGEATEVFAYAAHGFNQGIPGYSMDDALTVAIRFQSGAVANLMASMSTNVGGRVFLDVHSLRHNVHFTGWEHSVVIETQGGSPVEIKGEDNIFAIEDRVFIEAVRSGDRSGIRSTYADGLKSAEISLAANESARTGRPVAIEG